MSLNTSVSGLNAATARLQNAAVNIANARSTRSADAEEGAPAAPFIPQDVVQVSQAGGGVTVSLQPRTHAEVKSYDPEHPDADEAGFVSSPSVDISQELVTSVMATYDAKANLVAFQIQRSVEENTLNELQKGIDIIT